MLQSCKSSVSLDSIVIVRIRVGDGSLNTIIRKYCLYSLKLPMAILELAVNLDSLMLLYASIKWAIGGDKLTIYDSGPLYHVWLFLNEDTAHGDQLSCLKFKALYLYNPNYIINVQA